MARREAEERERLAKIDQLRVAHGGKPHDTPPPGDPAETFAVRKERIVARLVEWADQFEPHTRRRMHAARAKQIADHVLIEGEQLGLSEPELYDWLDEIRSWFLNGKLIEGKMIENPVGFLDARLEKLLKDRRVPSRKSKRRVQ